VDVAIFELNNNHNSHVCRTPDGTIYQLREEICEQLRQQIGDKCLRDLYIKANDIKGEWFNKVTFMKRGVVNCIKDFSLKDDNDYYGIEYHVVPGRTFKVVKQSKKQTGIIKLTDAEYTGFINVISNSQFKLMFTELNT
jgi:ABC-type antimicrobial peptide transport system ATPase subunit